jgi:hypothetical protein
LTIIFSKKSKVQSNGLAPAILEGLMPITTETEPEDIDDDAPSRVRLDTYHFEIVAKYYLLVCTPYY